MHWLTRHTMWFARPLAGRRLFRLWGVVNAVGRTTGRPYATPVAVIATHDGFIIPLPFGEGTAWARNVIAAGGARLQWNGREHRIGDPTVVDLSVPGADAPFGPAQRAVMRRTGIRAALRVSRIG